MDNQIPNIILEDIKSRGYAGAIFAGEYDGVQYFYYYRPYDCHYSGLPHIVKLDGEKIEIVTDFEERGRAFRYAMRDVQ